MASEIDICNIALGHLGDTATVASIDPPEGSAQAEHCARFYPVARDALLEMHSWGFATKRAKLALLQSGWPEWDYCYAQPSDALNLLAVIPPLATDDYSQAVRLSNAYGAGPVLVSSTVGNYVPQPFSAEILDDETEVIFTDQEEAVLRYTARVTDTTKFSPLFTNCLTWFLASMLAGPVIKGDAGAAEAKRCMQMMQYWFGKATESDANQRKVDPEHLVPWINGR